MLEEYLDIITSMENFADGIMVLDENACVVYVRNYRTGVTPLITQDVVGKNILEIYPELTEETSTIWKALRTGESTINKLEPLTSYDGITMNLLDNTFPIRQGGRIIGAVSIAKYPDYVKEDISVSGFVEKYRKDLYTLEDIVGRSPKMLLLRSQVERVSRTNSSVLIYGETGTGKEMVAQSIHTSSARKSKLFISQNCAAIPGNLLESIFFGTTKGSYTGAENKPGIFEIADGGTIFLDEINSMDINMQAKLLRVIEEKKITRIGGAESKKVDVRIVAAINEPPMRCIREGKMRADLFYRLGSVMIQIPPLRDRSHDINVMAEYFINQYNQEMGKSIEGLSQEVMDLLPQYDWPGNVREFKNAIEGAFNFCNGKMIEREDLPDYIFEELSVTESETSSFTQGSTLKKSIDDYEMNIILSEMGKTKNLTALAGRLGITRQALNQKMKKYGISASKHQSPV